MACMSLAMILALRPRWPEPWIGGLDKMYRLHKWLGIGGLALAVIHWLWAQGPKWAVGLGWLERPQRGPRPVIDNPVGQFLSTLRGPAEDLGEWAFYAAALLIVIALIHRIPYRIFYKTHRLLAVVYLVLGFHTVVLTNFVYWASPLGAGMAIFLTYGTWAAVVVLTRRIGDAVGAEAALRRAEALTSGANSQVPPRWSRLRSYSTVRRISEGSSIGTSITPNSETGMIQ
nr:ferric reductase-like transmembrane domain-containing protein [Afipia felis]